MKPPKKTFAARKAARELKAARDAARKEADEARASEAARALPVILQLLTSDPSVRYETVLSTSARRPLEALDAAWEPDWLQWTYLGLRCECRRHTEALHWLGYVDATQAEAAGADAETLYDVHGGVTYNNNEKRIGFDCAHLDDLSPGWLRRLGIPAVYRDLLFAVSETRSLAEQVYRRERELEKKD